VAVTSAKIFGRQQTLLAAACFVANFMFVNSGIAAVLPEDRTDIMTHYYNGGGLTVSGPAVLVRKGFDDTVSVRLNYYVDNITSASIDVVTNASEYEEFRAETSAGVDYLYEDTLMNIGYTKSDENDYNATTYNFGVTQEVFGGLTTVSMGYAHGEDTIGKSTDTTFEEDIKRDQYTLGVSQVLTKHFILSGSYEAISDEGFLNNPYRSARIGNAAVPEVYPETHRSHAFSLTGKHYLSTEGSVLGSYRYFWDTWGITAHNLELGYSQYLGGQAWIFDAHLRYYTQSKAEFYEDSFATAQLYMARDKELSTFNSYGVGASIAYKFLDDAWYFIDKGSAHLSLEYLQFNYDDFTDLRVDESTYLESYSFNAYVIEAFVSFWY
jgi:hypothetical protein